MEDKNDCPICFESLNGKTIGSPDSCDHKFCLACLDEWSKHGNFCPVDRQSFKKIISGNEVIQIKFKKRKKAAELYDISVCCEICKESKYHNDTVILCDCCDLAFHFDCLKPALKRVPRGSWFCPDCREVERKLKTKRTKKEDCPNSEQSSLKSRQRLSSSTKQTAMSLGKVNRVSSIIDRSSSSSNQTNISLIKENGISKSIDEAINIKDQTNQTYLSKKDYYQNHLLPKVNSPLDLPPGEFEDFFSICDNDDVILTNRRLLSTEEQCSQLLGHVRNSLITQQTERTSKALAAASKRNNVLPNFIKGTVVSSDDSSSSSVQHFAPEKDFPENASLNADNYFSDNEKPEFPHQSSSCSQRNRNAKNHTFRFSPSISNCMNELVLEDNKEKKFPIKELNETITSMPSSMCKNQATFSSTNPPEWVTGKGFNKRNAYCSSEKDAYEASSKTTKERYSDKLIAPESFNVFAKPVSNSVNNKSLNLDNLSKEELRKKETSKTNFYSNCRSLRRNLQVPQKFLKTKRLAAAIATQKMTQNIKSTYNECSSDEFSDSSNHCNVAKNTSNHHNVEKNTSNHCSVVKKDSKPKLGLNTSNHDLFANIEELLSDQDSTSCNNKTGENPSNEVSTSQSRSEIATLDSDSKNIKDTNITDESLNKSVASNSSSVHRTAHVTLPDYVKEGAKGIEIPMGSKPFRVLEKSPIKEPPILVPESINCMENTVHDMAPELFLEPLTVRENAANKITPIIKETEPKQNTLVVEELNNNANKSSPKVFSVFEKVTNDLVDHSEVTHSSRKTCRDAKNAEKDELPIEKDNYPGVKSNTGENFINNFQIRQIHYAIKAKMNLSAELRQIERETWLSRKSKSSKKSNPPKENKIRISSSSHHIIAGNVELYEFYKNTQLDNNKSADCKNELTEYNSICNPFYKSVSSSCPQKIFKVTEYSLKPFDKHVCFNKIPKDVLQSFMSPNSLKHLDIRKDGSLFLNWPKTN